MFDTISMIICGIGCGVLICLFIRVILALIAIPGEIRDLCEAVEKLTKVIEEKEKRE